MHVAAMPCGNLTVAAPKTGSKRVHLFPRRKAGDKRSVNVRGRAPLQVDEHAVASLFGLPQGEAAQKLGVSITAMKQLCRKLGIERWPYTRQKKQGSARAATRACAVVWPVADGGAASGIDMADEPESEPVLTPRSSASGAPTECNSPIRQEGPGAGPAPRTCAHSQESLALSPACAFPAPNPGPTWLPPSECDERWIDWIPARHHEACAPTAADRGTYAANTVDDPVRVDLSHPCAAEPLQHEVRSYDGEGDDLSWLLSCDKSLCDWSVYGRIDPRSKELCVLELTNGMYAACI